MRDSGRQFYVRTPQEPQAGRLVSEIAEGVAFPDYAPAYEGRTLRTRPNPRRDRAIPRRNLPAYTPARAR